MDAKSSDNASGAVNQQERLESYRIQNPQRPYAKCPRRTAGGEDMVRSAWRHAEPGRNDLALDLMVGGNNDVGPYPMQP